MITVDGAGATVITGFPPQHAQTRYYLGTTWATRSTSTRTNAPAPAIATLPTAVSEAGVRHLRVGVPPGPSSHPRPGHGDNIGVRPGQGIEHLPWTSHEIDQARSLSAMIAADLLRWAAAAAPAYPRWRSPEPTTLH